MTSHLQQIPSKPTLFKKSHIQCAALLLTGFVCSGAQAYKAGDMIFRAGPASLQPNDSSTSLKIGNFELSTTTLVDSPVFAGVNNNTQLGFTFTYMMHDHWGVEVLAATPFKHEIALNGGINAPGGTTKHLPPTVTANFYPMNASSPFQPYFGIGINYTTFFSENASPELNAFLNGVNPGETKLTLDDSWGLAVRLGADYAINENWLVSASMWKIDVDSEAQITHTGVDSITTDVAIDPNVYMLSIGYKY